MPGSSAKPADAIDGSSKGPVRAVDSETRGRAASLSIRPPWPGSKHVHHIATHCLAVGTPASSEDRNDDGPRSGALSDEQSAALDGMFRRHVDAARSAACAIVRDQRLAEDLAQAGILRLIASYTRPIEPVPFPADDDAFRARWIVIVENLAKDCVKKVEPHGERPAHAFWGHPAHILPSGKKVPERPLAFDLGPDSQFRNRADEDGAPSQPVRSERGLHYYPRADRDLMLDRLQSLLWWEIGNLPVMQREVLRLAWAECLSRAEIAEKLRISPHTVGTHTKRAYAALRTALLKKRYFPPYSLDADWHEIFVAMDDRAKTQRLSARRSRTANGACETQVPRTGETGS